MSKAKVFIEIVGTESEILTELNCINLNKFDPNFLDDLVKKKYGEERQVDSLEGGSGTEIEVKYKLTIK